MSRRGNLLRGVAARFRGLDALEPRMMLSVVTFIDDGEVGFSKTGTWGTTVEPGRYFHDDHTSAHNGLGANTAAYTFTGLQPGVYRVSATWRGDTNRATNTPFSVFDNNSSLGTFRINQQLAPNSLTDQGFGFGDIGTTWNITSTTLVVRLNDDADAYVDADAVRIERLSDLPAPAPQLAVEVNGVRLLSGQTRVDFGSTNTNVPVDKVITIRNQGQVDMHLGSINPPGNGFGIASGFANTTVAPGGTTTFTIRFNGTDPGVFQTQMQFHTDDPNNATFTVLVGGICNGTPSPLLPGFTSERIASGLTSVTGMAVAPDGRIFVLEQTGTVRIIQDNQLLPNPFIALNVVSSGEHGLLGIAFDPAFNSNHYVYLYYTVGPDDGSAHNRVSRFTASGNTVVANSKLDLLNLPPVGVSHNGGAMHFGLDGKLYIAVGDGATPLNAPSLGTPLGKILRINPDGSTPTDNPYYNNPNANPLIWAYGFRNPFTFAVQPGTGRIFVNDVGQETWEEIDDLVRGGNYGWPFSEGATTNPNFIGPVHAYQHVNGQIAIIGGAFYNPTTPQFPSSYVDGYFFADLGAGWVKWFDPSTSFVTDFALDMPFPVSIAGDDDGSVLVLTRGTGSGGGGAGTSGEVYRIEYTPSGAAPTIITQPPDVLESVGESATFQVNATGTDPLFYQWQREGVDIPGATGPSYTLDNIALSDSGSHFRVIIYNSLGTQTSNDAVLTVTTNHLPTATILTPTVDTKYHGGQVINFSGDASDFEDPSIPDSAFTWEIQWYTGVVARPAMSPVSGIRSGTFTIPDTVPYLQINQFYRVILSVADSTGMTRTVTRDIQPETAVISLASNLSGIPLSLDGQSHATPYSTSGVAGIVRSLQAPATLTVGGIQYFFYNWSDGGAINHDIATPATDTTFTALYAPAAVQYIDDRDTGFSTVGSWGFTVEPGRYFHDDHSSAIGGHGANVASYTFSGLLPGIFRVWATWRGDSNRATNTPFTILDGNTVINTLRINQQMAPSGLTDSGFNWSPIGGPYSITSDTLIVRLSDDNNAYADADAVRIERIGDLPSIGPGLSVFDGTTDLTGANSTDNFGTTPINVPVQKTFTVRNIGTAPLSLGALSAMPAGFSLISDFGSTNLAPNASTTFIVQLNAASVGNPIGTVSFTTNDPSHANYSFTITGSVITPPTVLFIDDRDPAFSTVGTWGLTIQNVYYGGDHSFARDGGGANVATYTFSNLQPGKYRVSATWRGDPNRATNTPFTVLDGNTSLGTVRINQESYPNTFTDAGFNFGDIGTAWNITGTTLKVRISDDANDYVDADAIRIERLGNIDPNLPPPPFIAIVDDRDTGFSFVGNWNLTNQSVYYGGDHSSARDGGGADVASYTFTGITPGKYRVSATWRSDPNRATNTPFTVLDGSTVLGTVRINQELAPNSLNDGGFNFGDIGTAWNITGTTLVVKISDDANDYADADAVRIERLGDIDPNLPPPPPPPVVFFIDDRDAGFATVGNWNYTVQPVYYGGDHSSARDGGGSNVASYTFTGLTPGKYRVSATWRGDPNRATNTPFTLFDGATNLGMVRINQENFPNTFTDAGFNFGDIGTAWNVTGTTLIVQISDDANDYADADAVRIERLGDVDPNIPPPPPQPIVITIDDRNAGFSTVGNWGFTVESGRYFGDDHSFVRDGGGSNVATYTFNNLTPGVYRVSATWRNDPNRATNTPFTIYDSPTPLGTVRVNQEIAPNAFTFNGFKFANIGTTWNITSTSLMVRISDDADDYVDLDAIRIERIGDLP